MTITTNPPEQTELLGKKLAARLNPGDVIAYYGDLGAGKTAFTRGLAAGLGVTECVTSPTYTIVNEYLSGRMPLFHFDMYRLSSSEELFEAVWGEKYFDSNNTVMSHIARLREKLHEQSKKPKFIKTVWGVGYTIEQ